MIIFGTIFEPLCEALARRPPEDRGAGLARSRVVLNWTTWLIFVTRTASIVVSCAKHACDTIMLHFSLAELAANISQQPCARAIQDTSIIDEACMRHNHSPLLTC